jgi:hypothetical protein
MICVFNIASIHSIRCGNAGQRMDFQLLKSVTTPCM